MICPDCEMEVKKLTSRGICTRCYKRIYSCKTKEKEYIPLKDLKGTKEYNRAMGRRLSSISKKTDEKDYNIVKVDVAKDICISTNSNEIKNKLDNDIKNYYTKLGIESDSNYIPLQVIFEWFYGLCQEESYIDVLESKRNIYDTLIVDALHELKANTKADKKFYASVGERMALIQSKRTPIDNEYEKYLIVKPAFDYLKNDSNFKKLIQDCRINLIKRLEDEANPKYITSTESMKDNDYTIFSDEIKTRKLKTEPRKNYYFKIKKVRNLYGNNNYQPFIYTSSITASSETEAKDKFLNYIRYNFSRLAFNVDDIEIALQPFKE